MVQDQRLLVTTILQHDRNDLPTARPKFVWYNFSDYALEEQHMTCTEPEMISIIEGPPPEFMLAQDGWSTSVWEGQLPRAVGVCQMRTFNAQNLMDRCRRAWGEGRSVHLDFPQMDGLRQEVEVLAAKPGHVEEGDLIYLWVAVPHEEAIIGEDEDDVSGSDDAGSLA
jgi:hypothetical protein